MLQYWLCPRREPRPAYVRTQDAASVVDEYIRACHEQGIYDVRIIHGKGKGVLRETVHALLERHPLVLDFHLDSGPSSWGATLARLRPNS